MKNYATIFSLFCCLFCLLYSHYMLESRLDQLAERLDQLAPSHIVAGHWVGACREDPKKNAALYVPFQGSTRVIQIMDGRYTIANFAITVHKGEVVMQLIKDGKVRLKKLWELTDESDFVRSVKVVE